ncbi:MAG: M1 family metallopeptidase [Saprospiraceae bacterium]|nr:M1 family metallopeptidase [Saprospiraceae bacterium]
MKYFYSMKQVLFVGISLIILFTFCKPEVKEKEPIVETRRPDPHSFSRPDIAVTKHLELELSCDFQQKQIRGIALYDIEHKSADEIIFDVLHLNIDSIDLIDNRTAVTKASYKYIENDEVLGKGLHVKLNSNTKKVKIYYRTSADAIALQWLNVDQTNTKKLPYLLTQSQSIYARSWIPCQDGPGIRFTYNAVVNVPENMMAVMSADNPQKRSTDGRYTFTMDIPIPAYLLALAVGDFDFKPIGNRTGVYASSDILDKAVWEFADLEKMLETAETLYGKYPWGRYDVIVLPSSFPFGGMENPKLTFLTPTCIAGDRSLTSLLAHELAHSWSGNLVTNATWEDFWLNEGFTTYFENRIMESLYGKSYADMLSLLGYQDLKKTIEEMGDTNVLTKLKLDLEDEDPEDALSDIAYEKGKTLLRYLEERQGRADWDGFLKSYFEKFKFKSNTTEGFVKYLDEYFPTMNKGVRDTMQKWIYNPGLIAFQPNYDNSRFLFVEKQLEELLKKPGAYKLKTRNWSTHEWLHAIRKLPKDITKQIIPNLETNYKLHESGNKEIAFAWLKYKIENNINAKEIAKVENFLLQVGRRKFVLPLYESLMKNGHEKEAKAIFTKAKSGYHPITSNSVNEALYPRI